VSATSLIGVGNPFRGDDGVGHWVVRALEKFALPLRLRVSDGEISGLLDCFAGAERVILIDAVAAETAGLEVGELIELDGEDPALLESGLRASTHAMGIAEAIAMARALDRLPEQLSVIGIASSDFDHGQGLSQPVAAAAERLVQRLRTQFST
jgi:hydrogenase maturation protease